MVDKSHQKIFYFLYFDYIIHPRLNCYKNIEATDNYKLYHALANYKKQSQILAEGGIKILLEDGRVFAFARIAKEGIVLVVTSMEKTEREIELNYDVLGLKDISNCKTVLGEDIFCKDLGGKMKVTLPSEGIGIWEYHLS